MVPSGKIKLCYCHAEEDATFCLELEKHLSQLERSGAVESWHPGRILPGEERDQAIIQHLEEADIILLLLSVDLLASSRGYDRQMQRAMDRHRAGQARVIPVMLRDADYAGAPFAGLQALPGDGWPINSRHKDERDHAWAEVARGIRAAAEDLARDRAPAEGSAAAAGTPGKSTFDAAASEQLQQRVATHLDARARRRSWLMAAAVGAVAILCVVASAVGWPVLTIPALGGRGGIVLAARHGPLMSAHVLHRRLCEELGRIDLLPVRCVTHPLSISRDRVRAAAVAAGATAVAFVDSDVVTVVPVQPLRGGLVPVESLPPIRVRGAAAQQDLVGLLEALWRPAGEARDDARSPVRLAASSEIGPEFSLLWVLLDWLDQKGRPLAGDGSSEERSRLLMELERELCEDRHQAAHDPACALARYLAALDCPAERTEFCRPALANLQELTRDAPDRRLRVMAGIEAARRTCASSPAEAAALLSRLAGEVPAGQPCERLLLLPPATCLRSTGSSAVQQGSGPWPDLEAARTAEGCPSGLRGGVLAEQGYWRMKAGRWEEARKDFERAYELTRDPEHMLSVAEALLLLGRAAEVRGAIVLGRILQPALQTHAAFLLWLASASEDDARELLVRYEHLSTGEQGAFDAADTLAGLACGTSASPTCRVYHVLVRPKTGASRDELAGHLRERGPR